MLLLSLVIGVILTILPTPKLKRKPPVIPKNKKAFYKEYINSNLYRNGARKKRLEYDNYTCQGGHIFRVKKGLEVHHKNYDRLGRENFKKDLITLCKKCHRKEHKK